jgi:predicted permease
VHGGVLVQQLGFLLFSVLLPIFLQIGAGYALQKRFPLNTATLSKVQFYIFIPAITFTSLYATRLDTQLLGRILLANLLLFILLLLLIWVAVFLVLLIFLFQRYICYLHQSS